MSDMFAYLASPELTAALGNIGDRVTAFHADVIRPWEESSRDVTAVWYRRLGYEVRCLGFSVKTEGARVPDGLSANRNRDWLIPKRGAVGESWRQDLARSNQRPQLEPVLRRFDIEPTIMVIDHGRRYTPGLVDTADGYYLTWGYEHPDPGPHLAAVPPSVYYAAVEAVDRMGDAPISVDGV